MKKIFITGCPRSGTTLLARLFNAFEGVHVITNEVSLHNFAMLADDHFDGLGTRPTTVVGKRTEHTIFSGPLSDSETEIQLNLIRHYHIKVLNCVRDGRAVVQSMQKAWGVYRPWVWMDAIDQVEEHRHTTPLWQLSYEEILTNTKEVQAMICTVHSLKANHPFTDYPAFVPTNCFQSDDSAYSPRPLEKPAKVPATFHHRRPNDIEHFNQLLKQLGYE